MPIRSLKGFALLLSIAASFKRCFMFFMEFNANIKKKNGTILAVS